MKQQEATPEQIDQYASKIKQHARKIEQYARKIEQYARTPGAAADEAERKRMGKEVNNGMHASCTACGQTVKLEPYQQRMLDEHAELSDRISKLEAFTGTEAFEQLPELERCLLNHQLIAMHSYAGILRHRIRLWSNSND